MAIKSVIELVNQAKANIENITPQQLKKELQSENTILIDIREAEELIQNGKIEGSVLAPRGMLEFYADPNLPYYKPVFNPEKRIVLHCASGGRSALAVQSLKSMGYDHVAHLDGGIKAWKDAGFDVA
ncbi:rhodanese-like domain-containing protein [Mucilaginibacter paludis]|uniref:Rhodanese-like protein n=1 Tax=Mucilaginibacter paludis DSM 18603 TaxID=714943 RepID=H1YA75_9SPHI|nr:rhodanese-like domain-containing protein [Mucilaginibacter paludis]EHQ25956.1 Rhodanese-like protein [Mucilaginibacter paludis DSM 18603]